MLDWRSPRQLALLALLILSICCSCNSISISGNEDDESVILSPSALGFVVKRGDESCFEIATQASILKLSERSDDVVSDWLSSSSAAGVYSRNSDTCDEYLVPRSESHGTEHLLIVRNGPAYSLELKFDIVGNVRLSGVQNQVIIESECAPVSYSELHVFDAAGKKLVATMQVEDNSIVLAIGDEATEIEYPVIIDPLAATPVWNMVGTQNKADFGHRVMFGDFNADGRLDIVISSPLESNILAAKYYTGAVRVFLSSGSKAWGSAFTIQSTASDSLFGYSLAIGKHSGSFDSLVVGAPRAKKCADSTCAAYGRCNCGWGGSYCSGYSPHHYGAMYMFKGGSGGITTAFTSLPSNQIYTGDFQNFFLGAAVLLDKTRTTDTYGDTFVTATESDSFWYSSDRPDGVARRLQGKSTNFASATLVTMKSDLAYSGSTNYDTTRSADAQFGHSSVLMDLNGDGYKDLVVSATKASKKSGATGPTTYLGAIFVYLGKSTTARFSHPASQTIWGPQPGSSFGWSLVNLGDIDGDGAEDLLVTAPNFNGAQYNEGKIFIYKGIRGTTTVLNPTPYWQMVGPMAGAFFGHSACVFREGTGASTRVNLLVGAPLYGNDERGMVAIIEQTGYHAGYPTTVTHILEGAAGQKHFGWAVAAGDVDGDGYTDALISTFSYMSGASRMGKVAVHLGLPRADLSLTLTFSPVTDPIVISPTATVTTTVTVVNAGPATTSVTVSIKMATVLPTNSMVMSGGGTCSKPVADQISCVGTVAPGTPGVITIVFNAATARPGTFSYRVTATSAASYDPTPANADITREFTMDYVSTLQIAGSVSPSSVIAGENVVYSYTLTNPTGPSGAMGTVFSVPLNARVSLVSAVPSQGSCFGGLVCDIGTVAKGASVTVVVTVRVKPSTTSTSITHTATVTTTSKDTPTLKSKALPISVSRVAQVNTKITSSLVKGLVGEPLYLSVTTSNFGPSDTPTAATTTVTWTAPFTLESAAKVTVSSGTCNTLNVDIANKKVICGTTSLLANTKVTILLNGIIPSTATQASMSVTSTVNNMPGENTADNTHTIPLEVTRRSNTAVYLFAHPDPANKGQPLKYTVTAMNRGPAEARDAYVVLDFPAGLSEYNYVTPSDGSVTCSALDADSVKCFIGSGATQGVMANGYSINFDITLTLPASTPDTLTAKATINGTYFDDYKDNNQATKVSGTVGGSDMMSILSAYPSSPIAGKRMSYSLTVLNGGPTTCPLPITAYVELPVGVTYATYTKDAIWSTCTFDTPTRRMTCAAGSVMNAGAQGTFVVQADVGSASTGSMVAKSSVTGNNYDSNASNNAQTLSLTIVNSVGLNIAMSANPPLLSGGELITYAVSYGNIGPSTAHSAYLRFNHPTQIVYESNTGTLTCTPYTGYVRCDLGTMAPAATGSFALKMRVKPTVSTVDVVMTAIIASTSDEDPPADNTATTTTQVRLPSADLVMMATAPASTFIGSAQSVSMTIFNGGPSTSVFSFTLKYPASLVYGTVSSALITCTNNVATTTLSCTGYALDASKSFSVVATFGTTGAVAGTASFTAMVTGSVADPVSTNNQKIVSTNMEIQKAVDLSVSMNSQASVYCGLVLPMSIGLTNAGPGHAKNAKVTVTLPPLAVAVYESLVPACVKVGDKYECTVATLAPGASTAWQLKLRVVTESVVNVVASVKATIDPVQNTEANTANNEKSLTVPTVLLSDVMTMVSTSVSTAYLGTVFTASSVVVNQGPTYSTNIYVTMTYDTSAVELRTVPVSPCTLGTPGTITCTIDRLDAKAHRSFLLEYRVIHDGIKTAQFGVTAAGDHEDNTRITDNTASKNVAITYRSDVFIKATSYSTKVYPATTVAYTLYIKNNGPTSANSVQVQCSTLNTHLSVSTLTGPRSTSCTLTNDHEFVCLFASMTPVEATNLYLGMAVSTSVVDIVGLSCDVICPSDFDTSNNHAEANIEAEANADLSVAVAPSTSLVGIGSRMEFNVTVSNAGPVTARGTVITMDLDSAMDFISTSVDSLCTYASVGHKVVCSFTEIPMNKNFRTSLTVRVEIKLGSTAGFIPFKTTITADSVDKNLANNVVTTSIQTVAACDVEVSLYTLPNPLPLNADGYIVATFKNKGPTTAYNSEFVVQIPQSMELSVQIVPGCSFASNVFTCNLGDKSSGATFSLVFMGKMTAVPDNSLVLIASGATSETDLFQENNYFEYHLNISQAADLSFIGSTYPSKVIAADTDLTTEFRLVNSGPAMVQNVSVLVTMDPQVNVLTAPTNCTLTGDHLYNCMVYDYTVGGTHAFAFKSRVPDAAVNVSFTATSMYAYDYAPSNDELTIVRTVVTDADLFVAKVFINSNQDVYAGERFLADVMVSNKGPTNAKSVQVMLTGNKTSVAIAPAMAGCVSIADGVVCSIAYLESGEILTLPIQVTILTPCNETLFVSVTSTRYPDPAPDNNMMSVAVTALNPKADVLVTVDTLDGESSYAQFVEAVVVFTVTNDGPHGAYASVLHVDLGKLFPNAKMYNSTTNVLGCGGTGVKNELACRFDELASYDVAEVQIALKMAVAGVHMLPFKLAHGYTELQPHNNNGTLVLRVVKKAEAVVVEIPSTSNSNNWQEITIGGGVVLLMVIAAYFMGLFKVKHPEKKESSGIEGLEESEEGGATTQKEDLITMEELEQAEQTEGVWTMGEESGSADVLGVTASTASFNYE